MEHIMKTIVVPLDGSILSEQALPYAWALAGAARTRLARMGRHCGVPSWTTQAEQTPGGRLILVRAVHARAFPGADPSASQIEMVEEAESYLRAVADQLRAQGVDAEPHVYSDEATTAIFDAARRHDAEMIVMSTHGRSGLGRAIFGSVADKVLRDAKIPVFLVPSAVERSWPTERPARILVPLDGSELAEGALESARSLAETFDAEIILLRVVEPIYPLYGEGYALVPFDQEAELAEAGRYLREAAVRLRPFARSPKIRTTVGQASSEVARVAREESADLIVMATHGRGGLDRLVLGSVSTGTVQHADVPILLTRPTTLQEGRDLAPTAAQPVAHG
jgi:nucleotide-binding universal stress UspA family protein